MHAWFRIAASPAIRTRALRVSLVVGTVLAAINHADTVVAGDISVKTLVQIGLTYLVPYAVSTYAGVEAMRKTPGAR